MPRVLEAPETWLPNPLAGILVAMFRNTPSRQKGLARPLPRESYRYPSLSFVFRDWGPSRFDRFEPSDCEVLG
ncbi:hypothetical protein Halru_3108 [Halovivax ruber XH-70]|uniref:Uncharacterized protein n=1 Tax=Halovivax ruber (strain DSM 18193 / JCM 13892 / XH-70) TaxID=797302 RepID=L0IFY3_HALRX|nr:hypothetical protein Halru_3108 [Halovivax ruber XH-70]